MYFVHGGCNTRLYGIWHNMIQRCCNPNNARYKSYGGRGIKIYEPWFEFEQFANWAYKAGYSDKLTLEREDNNRGYNPFNCSWKTPKEQMNNTRRNRNVEYGGETHTVAQWSEITGLRANTIITRLNRGWSVKDALTVPIGGKYGEHRKTI